MSKKVRESCETKGKLEKQLTSEGVKIAGCDEVGRGCLAGPVYSAVAILDFDKLFALDSKSLELIRDSKTLSSKQRVKALEILESVLVNYSIAACDAREIESLGIVQATFKAMAKAFSKIEEKIDTLLIDGNLQNPLISCPQHSIIGGDNSCFSIAAASIIAKEARDHFMRESSALYPEYGFQDHVGYGTRSHLEALEKFGITPLHRRNFAPIAKLVSLPAQGNMLSI